MSLHRYHCAALWSWQVPGRSSSLVTHQEERAVPGDQQCECGSVEAPVQAVDGPTRPPGLQVNTLYAGSQCRLQKQHFLFYMLMMALHRHKPQHTVLVPLASPALVPKVCRHYHNVLPNHDIALARAIDSTAHEVILHLPLQYLIRQSCDKGYPSHDGLPHVTLSHVLVCAGSPLTRRRV